MSFFPVSFGNLAGLFWSYCDVMFTKRKPDPEKNKKHLHVQNGLLHDNGRYRISKCSQIQEEKHTLESKIHPVECFDRQCKIAVEKFKSCSSQAEIYCFEFWEDTILVFPCDCVGSTTSQ